jgi:hypothetical protein
MSHAWLSTVVAIAAQSGAFVDAGPRPIEPVEVEPGEVEPGEPGEHNAARTAGARQGSDDVDAGVPAPAGGGDAGPAGWSVKASVEPPAVVFGGEVDLVVVVTRPPKARIAIPDDLGATQELPRTARPPQRTATELPDGRIEETLRFGFLALDVKDATTPRFVLTIVGARAGDGPGAPRDGNDGNDDNDGNDGNEGNDGNDGGDVLEVPALPVRIVVEALPDPSDGGVPDGALAIEPAAGVISYRVEDHRPWALIALALVVAAVVVAVRAAIKARQLAPQTAPGPPPPPPRPAHEVALARLDALMPLLASGEVTVFVERLMDEVLRDYLAGRFSLAAGTRTTKEIVTDLLSIAAVNLDVGLVERVGQDADLVKFARASLAAEQAHAMAGRVRALIVATAPPASEPSPPEAR